MSRVNAAYLVNTLWRLSCRRSLHAFNRGVRQVEATQSQVLRQIVSHNQDSEYGRQHHFTRIQHVNDFRELVPTGDYEMFEPWINQICRGRTGVLTTEPVQLLEPTSGSVAGRRLIPYTESLKRQFQAGINPWIADLFSARPALRRGRAYWMVSPPFERQQTSGGLEIGFADDTQYLGLIGRLAAGRVMAIPPGTMNGIRTEDAPYQTLVRLLAVSDLSLISVWSPTFLTNLIRLLESSQDRLLRDLRTLVPKKAVDRIEGIFKADEGIRDKLANLWPQLGLISCWADSSAAHCVHEITDFFPCVEIQAKGLVSTEAFVSLPIAGQLGSALSVRSHFFEFQAASASSNDTLLAHELSFGTRYRVIVTTGGGLYRYQTHDVIEVVGFLEQCPLIQFCGRANRTSDLVGEKLTEVFVASAIARMAKRLSIVPVFAMLVPHRNPPGYRLLIELNGESEKPSASTIAATLESLLCENPWYDHAIQVGQLSRLRTTVDESNSRLQWDTYEEMCLKSGIRRGDIKPTSLETRFDWDLASN